MTDRSNPLNPDKPIENQEIEEFFHRLPSNFRWPKPNAEAVAAAMEAIQRLSGGSDLAPQLAADTSEAHSVCAGCASPLPAGARFCVSCGLPADTAAAGTAAQPAVSQAQHHFHHHYHHFVSAQGGLSAAPGGESETGIPRGRAPGPGGATSGGRAEMAARQVALDWAQACNTKHIDDLVELYAADATLIRSSVPPVRSLPAIREFLLSMLDAGLGDVEMESLRLEIMGEIALDLGRCKMLVPIAMGKRREERGKYLIVLVRQPVGTWKILADCWSSDLPVAAAPPAEAPARKGSEAATAARKPR